MYIVVYVTVPNIKTARVITEKILNTRVCACVNIVKDIQSFFWWQENIDKAKECLLIIKTKKRLFNKLKNLISQLHPYSIPEIIALPIVGVNASYARWLNKETRNG